MMTDVCNLYPRHTGGAVPLRVLVKTAITVVIISGKIIIIILFIERHIQQAVRGALQHSIARGAR